MSKPQPGTENSLGGSKVVYVDGLARLHTVSDN